MMIRRAELDDAEAIARVLQDAFIEYQSLYPPERYKATVCSPDELLDRLEEGPGWVALLDGKIVGTVSVVSRDEGLYIRGMGIVPVARGLRIGEQLLNEVEDYARANGFNRMFLGTTPFLHRAIRLYEKFGFTFCEALGSDLFGTAFLAMEKKI